MHLDEHVEREAVGDLGEVAQLGVGERGGDEKNGVGAMGAGLDDLVLVDDEILAQAGQRRGAGGELEVAQAALEVRLVGEDGKRGGAAGALAAGQPLHIEVGADQAFGRRRLFDFGNDGRSFGGAAAQCGGPAPRPVPGSAALQPGERSMALAGGHGGARRGQNRIEAALHALPLSIRGWAVPKLASRGCDGFEGPGARECGDGISVQIVRQDGVFCGIVYLTQIISRGPCGFLFLYLDKYR